MRRALTCGGVRSPPSAPGSGGAASAALSARAAQRGSTTFVSASLHRALTLGASSGEGSGRDNNTPPPPPPPPPRRRRPPVVAATHGGCLGSGLGLTTTPGLGPRALCRPQGRAAGRGEAGATGLRLTVGAASVRGWAGGCFRGDRGGEGEVSEPVAVGTGPDFLLPSPPPRTEVAELPFPPLPPPPRGGSWCARPAPARSSPSLSDPRQGGGRATGLAGWALTSTTPPSRLALSAFPLGPDARPGARTHVTLRESRR